MSYSDASCVGAIGSRTHSSAVIDQADDGDEGHAPLRMDRRPPLTAPDAAGHPARAGASHTYTITINPPPGADPAAIARAVAAELDRRERQSRSRTLSRLGDID